MIATSDEVLMVVARHKSCQVHVVVQALGSVADQLLLLACQGLVRLDMLRGTISITDAGMLEAFGDVADPDEDEYDHPAYDDPNAEVEW